MAIFKNITSPSLGLFIFTLQTLAYLIFEVLTKGKYASLVFKIYITVILFSQFLLNINLTRDICGEANTFIAFIYTFIPWTIIFGIIVLFLGVFPGWLAPFSNTFGYFLIRMYGLNKKFEEVVKSTSLSDSKQTPPPPGTPAATSQELLQNILANKSILVNEIPDANTGFDNFLISLNDMGLLKVNMDARDSVTNDYTDTHILALQDLIRIKFLIAKIIWYLLTGLLTISIAYNSIIQSECKNSIKYIEKTYSQNQKEVEKTNNENSTNTRKYVQRGT
jgi:hypothetical protein